MGVFNPRGTPAGRHGARGPVTSARGGRTGRWNGGPRPLPVGYAAAPPVVSGQKRTGVPLYHPVIKATRPGSVPMFDPATNMTTYEPTPDDWDPSVHYAGASHDDEQEEEQGYEVYYRAAETGVSPP